MGCIHVNDRIDLPSSSRRLVSGTVISSDQWRRRTDAVSFIYDRWGEASRPPPPPIYYRCSHTLYDPIMSNLPEDLPEELQSVPTDPAEEMNQMRGHKATLSNPRPFSFSPVWNRPVEAEFFFGGEKACLEKRKSTRERFSRSTA
jgi:hypothetical protein